MAVCHEDVVLFQARIPQGHGIAVVLDRDETRDGPLAFNLCTELVDDAHLKAEGGYSGSVDLDGSRWRLGEKAQLHGPYDPGSGCGERQRAYLECYL